MGLLRGQSYALSRRFLVAVAWVSAVFAVGLGGCSGDDDVAPSGGRALSEGCLINTDCNTPLVCAFRRCHVECKDSRDCPLPQRCIASDRPFYVCQLESEQPCRRNSDCGELQICASDLQCRDGCASDRDCFPGQTCASGACAVPSELENGKLPEPKNGSSDASAGVSCTYNSDCADPLVCLRGQCVTECKVDRDCAVGFVCQSARCAPRTVSGGTGGASGTGGAPNETGGASSGGQSTGAGGKSTGGSNNGGSGGASTGGRSATGGTDAGQACAYNSECASGQICRNGACVPECRVDRDCTPGDACQAGACVHVVPPGAPPGFGSPCALNSDCPSDLVCNAIGRCTWECTATRDCPLSYCCSAIHTCVTGSACQTQQPDAGSGSDGGLGRACLGDLECQDTSVCNGFERCVTGHCAAAAKAACDDENPCTQDGCSETTGQCSHSPSGNTDKDFDGHQPVACGGDDCDDTNGDVYKSAPEKCDGIDNNCDGKIDEGVWNLGTSVTLPLGTGVGSNPGGSKYPDANAGAPAIARLSDGSFVVAAVDEVSGGLVGIQGWALDSALKVTKGPVPTVIYNAQGAQYPLTAVPTLATNGSMIVLGGYQVTLPNTCQWAWKTNLAYGTSIDALTRVTASNGTVNPCAPWYNAMGTSGAEMAWNGSKFLLAFSDYRDGTSRAYLDSMSSAGSLGGSKTALADINESQDYGSPDRGHNRVVVAVGTTTALVAWATTIPGGGIRPRYALYDLNLGGLVAGPTDLSDFGNGTTGYPTSVGHVGKSFAIASQNGTQADVNVRLVDDTTGVKGGVTTIANPTGSSDTRITGIGGGFMVTYAAGTAMNFGWAPEDVTKGFATRALVGGSTTSTASIAVIDAKHAVLTWADGVVHVAPVTCGP